MERVKNANTIMSIGIDTNRKKVSGRAMYK